MSELLSAKTLNEKLEIFKRNLKRNGDIMFFLITDKTNTTKPFGVIKADVCKNGFGEVECHLFSYTYTEGNRQERQFMMEQGYVLKNGKAYDIQTPLGTWSQDALLGDMQILTKAEMVNYLLGVDA